MKKFARRLVGLALALVLVCGSGMSARASAINDLSGKEFISGSNGTMNQYVNDIAPRHVAVLAQLGSIDVCAEYGVNSGIQQFCRFVKYLLYCPQIIHQYLFGGMPSQGRIGKLL